MVSNKSGGGPARPIVYSGGLSNEQRVNNAHFKNTAAGKAYPDLIEGAKKKVERESLDIEGQKRREKTARKKKDKLETLFPDMASTKHKTGKKKKKTQAGGRPTTLPRIMSMSAPASSFGDADDDTEDDRATKTQFHHKLEQHMEEKGLFDSDCEDDRSETRGDDSQDEAAMEDSASEQEHGSAKYPASQKGEGAQVVEAGKASGPVTAAAKQSPSAPTASLASKPTAPSAPSPAASSPPVSGCCVIC